MNSGTKIGAKIAHLGMLPVRMMSSRKITTTNPTSRARAGKFALLSQSAMFTAVMVAMLE